MTPNYTHTLSLNGTHMALGHEGGWSVLRAYGDATEPDTVLQVKGEPLAVCLGLGTRDPDLSYLAVLTQSKSDDPLFTVGLAINRPNDGVHHHQQSFTLTKPPTGQLTVTYQDDTDSLVVTSLKTQKVVATITQLTGFSV